MKPPLEPGRRFPHQAMRSSSHSQGALPVSGAFRMVLVKSRPGKHVLEPDNPASIGNFEVLRRHLEAAVARSVVNRRGDAWSARALMQDVDKPSIIYRYYALRG